MQFGGTKLVKQIHPENTGLINGLNKLADAVGSTLGASGRTVVLEDDFGNAHVTKDGVTVARSINLNDPVENLGVTMIKQASSQTASKAGDGTTTSTVLAQAIVNEYFAQKGDKVSFRDVREGVEMLKEFTINQIERRAIDIDDEKLEYVSSISANNDNELGALIADAFKQAGDNGVVTMEASQTSETYIDVVEGTKLTETCSFPAFYTNVEKELAELDKPLIFLSATEIDNIRKIQDVLEYTIKNNRSILLIAPLTAQPLKALGMNKVKGNIKVNVIPPPSFGQKRVDMLEDIALLVGAKVYDDSLGDAIDAVSVDMLGSADKAISDTDGTVLVVENKSDEVVERIDYLRELLDDEEHHILTKHLENRLALLNGGVARIFVGADTEVELKEKQDRVDDAVQAVKAAKKEGILPGGGSALYYISCNNDCTINSNQLKGWEILREALKAPFKKILSNAGLGHEGAEEMKWGEGIDVIDAKVKDMVEAGIVDPAMVTKQALTNAVSVALTILSTDTVISNVRE